MAAELEISSLLFCLDWEFTDVENKPKSILSKTVKFCDQMSFRAGLKNSANPTLVFIAFNLNKMGMKAVAVNHLSVDGASEENQHEIRKMVRENQEDDNGSVQLFMDELKTGIVTGNRTFRFHIYIQGIVEDYRIHRMDFAIRDQLSLNRFGTDFEIIAAGGKRFPVHKFILAARSPVFEALFCGQNQESASTNQDIIASRESTRLHPSTSEIFSPSQKRRKMSDNSSSVEREAVVSEFKEIRIDSVDADCMSQFIEFIYTGLLDDPVCSRKLKNLAEVYQIKTLIKVCEAAAVNIEGNNLASLALDWDLKEEKPLVKIPDDDYVGRYFWPNIGVHRITFSLKSEEGKESFTRSETFVYLNNEKLFRVDAKIDKIANSTKDTSCLYELKLIFLAFQLERINCRVVGVIYSDDRADNSDQSCLNDNSESLKLNEVFLTEEGNILQKFTRSDKYRSVPHSIIFHIHLESTVSDFIYNMLDSTWQDQLWSAASTNNLTDVALLVGEESMNAHRFILSARSPVFAAMFNSGMIECRTGKVRIENVDPAIFRDFLKFLYTGMLEPSADREEIFVLADKYQVETLMNYCRPATEPTDVDDFTEVFLSC